MNVLRGKESRRRMVSESGLLYDLLGYDTADSQVDLHRLADRRNNVLGFFMPCVFRSRVPFPALARSAYPPRFHPSTCRKRDRAALPAKSSVHGVEHRTQSEMDGSALRLKLHRTLSISR